MPTSDRLNLLVIVTDDQGPWAMGCAGNDEIITPNLDRLASRGVRLENFFCASPVCSPARASLLTGRVPSFHGVLDWLRRGNVDGPVCPGSAPSDRAVEYLRGIRGYTDVLAENGWTCGLSGKWHLGDCGRVQKGFAHWFVHGQGSHYYHDSFMYRGEQRQTQDRYLTHVITDDALAFLDSHADLPFCCEVHYTAPHSPWDCHPPETVALYDDCPFVSCPDLPLHPWNRNDLPPRSPQERRDRLAGYFAAVTELDRGVGQLLDKLDALGLTEQTVVLFTSDNGMNMGHHGLWGKGNASFPQNMYEESVKVPTILAGPGVEAGRVETGLFSHLDWFPTVVDFFGLDVPETAELPGQSFAGLLRGQSLPGRQDVVVCEEYGPVRMVRDRDYKYIHRYPYGPHELYNLREDPAEERNLVDTPQQADRVAAMRRRLDAFFVRYGRPDIDAARQPVTGWGQVGPVGAAGQGRQAFFQPPRSVDDEGRTLDRPGLQLPQ